jgi:hypothetical protein
MKTANDTSTNDVAAPRRHVMTARRTLLLASAAALMGVPTWAASSAASSGHGIGHGHAGSPPGQTKDADEHGTTKHGAPTSPGKSHKCKQHGVAYVVSGTLETPTPEKPTLVKNEDGTYSGEISLKEIKQTNHHAKGAKNPFTVKNVHVTFGLADTNNDGSVGLDDLKEGDGVKLIGKITTLAKRCDHTGFTPTVTFRKVVFTAPTAP